MCGDPSPDRIRRKKGRFFLKKNNKQNRSPNSIYDKKDMKHDQAWVYVHGVQLLVLSLVQEGKLGVLQYKRWHIDICQLDFCNRYQDVVHRKWNAVIRSALLDGKFQVNVLHELLSYRNRHSTTSASTRWCSTISRKSLFCPMVYIWGICVLITTL